MICRLTPKSCQCTPALRLAKTVVFCCPDQLNKSLTDSKIESVRLLLPMYARFQKLLLFNNNVCANSTFVVATSQSQRVALSRGSAAVTSMQPTLMAEWLSEECRLSQLYEVISKEYSNRIKRMLVVLAYDALAFAHDLPFCVFACLCRR